MLAKPTATLTGGGVLCEGDSTNLLVTLTGKTPFELVYAIDEIAEPALNTSRRKITLPITSDQESTYTLVSMSDENGCTAILRGAASTKVFPKPKIELIQDTFCNETNEHFILS